MNSSLLTPRINPYPSGPLSDLTTDRMTHESNLFASELEQLYTEVLDFYHKNINFNHRHSTFNHRHIANSLPLLLSKGYGLLRYAYLYKFRLTASYADETTGPRMNQVRLNALHIAGLMNDSLVSPELTIADDRRRYMTELVNLVLQEFY
jgi:hypothetical protein